MRDKIKNYLNFKNNETNLRLAKTGFKRIIVVAAIIWIVNLYNLLVTINNISPVNNQISLLYLIFNGASMIIMIVFIIISLFTYKKDIIYLWLQRIFYIILYTLVISIDILANSGRSLGFSNNSYIPTFIAFALISIFPFFNLKEIAFILLSPIIFIIFALTSKYAFDINTILIAFLYSFLAIIISQMNYYVNYINLEKTEELNSLNKKIEKLIYTDSLTGYYSQWGISNILENHLNKERKYFILSLELNNIDKELVLNNADVANLIVSKLDEVFQKSFKDEILYIGHLFKDQIIIVTNYEEVREKLIESINNHYQALKIVSIDKKPLIIKSGLISSNTWQDDLKEILK